VAPRERSQHLTPGDVVPKRRLGTIAGGLVSVPDPEALVHLQLRASPVAQVISRPRVLAWMRRVFAGSFVALSAKLALTRQ